MYDQPGFMAEITKRFSEQAQVTVPKKIFGSDTQICIQEDFHSLAYFKVQAEDARSTLFFR